jgi:hypothetical protein
MNAWPVSRARRKTDQSCRPDDCAVVIANPAESAATSTGARTRSRRVRIDHQMNGKTTIPVNSTTPIATRNGMSTSRTPMAIPATPTATAQEPVATDDTDCRVNAMAFR